MTPTINACIAWRRLRGQPVFTPPRKQKACNIESPRRGPKPSRGLISELSTVWWLTPGEIPKANYNDNQCLHRLAEVPRSARFHSSTKTESTQQRITQKRSETKPRFDLDGVVAHRRRDPKGKLQRQSTLASPSGGSEVSPLQSRPMLDTVWWFTRPQKQKARNTDSPRRGPKLSRGSTSQLSTATPGEILKASHNDNQHSGSPRRGPKLRRGPVWWLSPEEIQKASHNDNQ